MTKKEQAKDELKQIALTVEGYFRSDNLLPGEIMSADYPCYYCDIRVENKCDYCIHSPNNILLEILE